MNIEHLTAEIEALTEYLTCIPHRSMMRNEVMTALEILTLIRRSIEDDN